MQFISSYFILKIHFYKLQYFSLFLNVVIFIIILIIDIINIIYNDSFKGNVLYFYPFYIIFISIEYSYVKKILLEGFISIYLLMIIKGTIESFLLLILSLILYFTTNNKIFLIFSLYFNNVKYAFLFLIYLISHFFINLFL